MCSANCGRGADNGDDYVSPSDKDFHTDLEMSGTSVLPKEFGHAVIIRCRMWADVVTGGTFVEGEETR